MNIDLLFFNFNPIDSIGKTLQWLIEARWIWRKYYGLFDILLSNIQILSTDRYFKYIFGERNLIILLQCSSHSPRAFLDNLRVNFDSPSYIQEHWVKFCNLVTLVIILYWFEKSFRRYPYNMKKIIINMFQSLLNMVTK